MQQLNKKKSTRAVDAHTGTVYIQRGTTRGEGEERREKGRETRGKENPQTQAKSARRQQLATSPGVGRATGARKDLWTENILYQSQYLGEVMIVHVKILGTVAFL